MAIDPRGREQFHALLPESLVARAVLALLGLVLFVLAFFFVLAVAIILSAVATGALLRWWWLSRKLAPARAGGVIEGEYVVVERTGHERLEKPRR